jgi:hypothetical protein
MDDADEKKKTHEKRAGKGKVSMYRASGGARTGGRPEVYEIIGRRLRNYYDEVAAQPVPERFLELLEQLDSKTASKKEQ